MEERVAILVPFHGQYSPQDPHYRAARGSMAADEWFPIGGVSPGVTGRPYRQGTRIRCVRRLARDQAQVPALLGGRSWLRARVEAGRGMVLAPSQLGDAGGDRGHPARAAVGRCRCQ